VTLEDEAFLLEMMERDDVTVISDGLADEINSAFWTREYIEGCIGSEYHHKFRSFETAAVDRYGGEEGRQQEQQLRENDGWYSMKFSDYFSYLQRREYAKGARLSSHASIHDVNGDGLEREFSFVDSHGKEITIDVENVVIVRRREGHTNEWPVYVFFAFRVSCPSFKSCLIPAFFSRFSI
jgi:hypothetical protein